MSGIPRSYDPKAGIVKPSGHPMRRIPNRATITDPDKAARMMAQPPVEGQVTPPLPRLDKQPPLCAGECRLKNVAPCGGICKLASRDDGHEPKWPVPPKR